ERGAELVLRRPRYARRCPALEVESENVGLPAHVGVVEKAAAVTQEPGLVVIAGPIGRIPRCAQLDRLPLDAEIGNEDVGGRHLGGDWRADQEDSRADG